MASKREKSTQRKLTAILCADVAGYSRLMGNDEEATVATLGAYRKVFTSKIKKHRGRVVDAKGDALLAEFAAVTDAVSCAVEIQRDLAERNSELSDNRRMDFRIGINMGEVMVKGEEIYGDGVNVAARLESLAEPGGVCISRPVYDQVKSKLKLEYEYLGEQQVKNIAEPVRAYQVLTKPGDAAQRVAPAKQSGAQSESSELPALPSIAVLPFQNLSGDSEQEFFGDGLVEDILTSLSAVSSMTIIARNSTFTYKGRAVDVRQVARDLGVQYILEGSVRQSGNRLRITAQLIDSTDGSHLWAEKYDRVVEDIFDIQDEITKEIVTALRVNLTDSEQALLLNRGTNNVQAWSQCVQALEYFQNFNPADSAKALELAERAVSLDPGYALAWALLGYICLYDSRTGFTANSREALTRGEEFEEKARTLDETNVWVLTLSIFLQMRLHHFERAVEIGERAISLYPGSAHLRAWYGYALFGNGQAEQAIFMIKDAMRLNPHFPGMYSTWLSRALDTIGKTGEAMQIIEAGLARTPTGFGLHFNRAGILSRDGPETEAKQAVADLRRISPGFRASHVQTFLMFRDQEYGEIIAECLRKAGLPD